MTIIDAHQHFWRLARGDYRFPRPDDRVLYRDFLPSDFAAIIADAGVTASVAVQATDTIAETAFLLELASRSGFVAGVVGWCDPQMPASMDDLLRLPGKAALVGVRPMLQGLPDISWLVGHESVAQLERIAEQGLVFDALVDPRQLFVISDLCQHLPSLKVVVDHMGKPWRAPEAFDQWTAGMQELARVDNCWVKVSGFPFAASDGGERGKIEALVRSLGDWFGSGRLIWGSDWPVVEREGGYRLALRQMERLFSADQRDAVFAANATALYGLGEIG